MASEATRFMYICCETERHWCFICILSHKTDEDETRTGIRQDSVASADRTVRIVGRGEGASHESWVCVVAISRSGRCGTAIGISEEKQLTNKRVDDYTNGNSPGGTGKPVTRMRAGSRPEVRNACKCRPPLLLRRLFDVVLWCARARTRACVRTLRCGFPPIHPEQILVDACRRRQRRLRTPLRRNDRRERREHRKRSDMCRWSRQRRRRGRVRQRQRVVVRDGLQLERMLLCVMCGEDLVEYDDRAVAVARRQEQALAIRRPARVLRISKRCIAGNQPELTTTCR